MIFLNSERLKAQIESLERDSERIQAKLVGVNSDKVTESNIGLTLAGDKFHQSRVLKKLIVI